MRIHICDITKRRKYIYGVMKEWREKHPFHDHYRQVHEKSWSGTNFPSLQKLQGNPRGGNYIKQYVPNRIQMDFYSEYSSTLGPQLTDRTLILIDCLTDMEL